MKKSYKFSEYSLMVYPNIDNHLIRFPTIIRVFNRQLLLNENFEFFQNYWIVNAYIDYCFLRTGYITHNELIEMWEKQSDKSEKLTEIFWSFINSH